MKFVKTPSGTLRNSLRSRASLLGRRSRLTLNQAKDNRPRDAIGTKKSRVELSGGLSSKKPMKELIDHPVEITIVLKDSSKETRSKRNSKKIVARPSIKRDPTKGKIPKVPSIREKEVDPASSPKSRGDVEEEDDELET